jgi:pyrroloquinoline quinone (PQQ) biosynthesis protein C
MNVDFNWPKSIDEDTRKGIVSLFNDAIGKTTVIGYTRPLGQEEGDALVDGLQDALARGSIALFSIRVSGSMIGMAILSSSGEPNCRHIANLSKGIIRSDHQKSGVVKTAFLEIAKYCENQGYTLITLDVREHSAPHKIWLGLGFTQYGRLDDYARVDDISHPGVFLSQATSELMARLGATGPRTSAALLSKQDFEDVLRAELEARVTLTHPIVKKIVNGQPDWDLLRYMTLQGYQLTKNFLEYIETIYHHCPRGIHKRRLLLNMFEEETGRFSKTDNHVKLMQNFIKAIGIGDQERDTAVALPATQLLIDYRMNLVRDRRRFHMGAAAVMIASEGQNLETTAGQARHDLLPRVYGLTESDLLFFSVHQKEDVGHVKEGINLVADICDTAQMQQEAIEAVRRTCDLFYGMYEGVAEALTPAGK